MKVTGELFNLDYCIFPIGDNFTMGVDDAIMASKFVKCSETIRMHYDTFPSIEINKTEAIEKFKNANLHLRLLQIGETIDL